MPDSPSAAAVSRPARRHTVRRTLIVTASILGALAVAVAATIFGVGSGSAANVLPTDDHSPRFAAGAVLPLSAPVPSDALFVSIDAAPGGNGSIDDPFATVNAALDRVRETGTIVVRGGVYHEAVFVGRSKHVTIQSYPGEDVVFDGSVALAEWTQDGDSWTTRWTADFDSSPSYTRGGKDGNVETWTFLDPAYPLAAHPDQVWIDGERLRQVATAAEVDGTSFAVDTERDLLVIGADPAGREVRASDLQLAFKVRSDGSTLSGLTIRRFAPSIPDMGAVVLEGNGSRMVDVAIEESATSGVFVTGTGSTLERVTVRDSGLIGVAANFADRLTLDGVLLTGNNSEHFNHAPVSGGFKITRSQHLTVRNSVMNDNLGPGIWIDQSVLDSVISSTDVLDNAGHGLFAEISNRLLLVDVVIAGNRRQGLKINDTSEVMVWRSTIVGNGVAIAILQEQRRGDDPSVPGHDERQPMPDPEMPWVIGSVVIGNSIIGDSRGSARDGAVGGDGFVWVQDYSNEFTARDMGIELTGNLFYRTAEGYPPRSIVWQLNAGGITPYRTLPEFQDAVAGTETNRELLGELVDASFSLAPYAQGIVLASAPSPPDVVRALLGDRAVGVGAIPASVAVVPQDGSSAPGSPSASPSESGLFVGR